MRSPKVIEAEIAEILKRGPIRKVTRATIGIGSLITPHREEVVRIREDDRPEPGWRLDPDDLHYVPIVRRTERGFAVVDGMHRIAGMTLFGVDEFPVIVVDADQGWLKKIDGDAEIGSHPELDAIYAAAGL